jgi:NADH dehydrogenase
MAAHKTGTVVIIGAGFAGLWALKSLAGRGLAVTIIDRNNYHTFLPLLYQVAAAEIEPEQIAYPVRTLARGFGNCRFIRSDVKRIDYSARIVHCGDHRVPYDYLIVAPGSVTHHYGVRGADVHAFGLKSLDEAMILRNHLLSCFERAAYEADAAEKKRLLSFVVIGAGPTGVEYMGALAELVRGPLNKDFPTIAVSDVTLCLVESGERVLSVFNERSSAYALKKLSSMGVAVMLKSQVREVTAAGLILSDGGAIDSSTGIWPAGVRGNDVSGDEERAAAPGGRVAVDETLRMKGHDGVYVAGDLAGFTLSGAPLPMVATVAIQQGIHAAKNILRQAGGLEPLPFRFRDKGTMATIGRNAAITRVLGREFRGFVAWVLWLSVHIMYLIGFRNKIMVMVNWVWNYMFFEKSVRLILPRCCDSPGRAACLHEGRRCGGC